MTMERKIKFWILVIVIAALCSACSTDNKSGQGQEEATKPPPQIRVETLPSLTPPPPLSTETVVLPTLEPTAAQVFIWPTPDEAALEDQINSMMDEMDNKLKSENINIKP